MGIQVHLRTGKLRSMRILVVCGAGASSTFVALRLRRAAHAAGLDLTTSAGSGASLAVDIETADIVLVGPHLRSWLDEIRSFAGAKGVRVELLPEDIFKNDPDGTRALAIVTSAEPQTQH